MKATITKVRGTALEEAIKVNDKKEISAMIEAKEKAFIDATENAEYFAEIGDTEMCNYEFSRARLLDRQLKSLKKSI